MEINPPETACCCPCGGVIKTKQKQTRSRTQYSLTVEYICQCTVVHSGRVTPRVFSLGDGTPQLNTPKNHDKFPVLQIFRDVSQKRINDARAAIQRWECVFVPFDQLTVGGFVSLQCVRLTDGVRSESSGLNLQRQAGKQACASD